MRRLRLRAGIDAFANCMMSGTQQREAQQAADRRAAAQAAAATQAATPVSQPVAPPKPMKCTTTTKTVGNTTTSHQECHS